MNLLTKRTATHALVVKLATTTAAAAATAARTSSSTFLASFFHQCYHSSTSKSFAATALILPFPHPSPTTSTTSLRHLLDSANISKIAFLRHGNTNPKPTDGTDYDRQLTDLGMKQARDAGTAFASLSLPPLYHVILSSPAPRCIDTTRFFLESLEKEKKEVETPEILTIPVLYDGTMQPEGSRLFRRIGYAPLRSYLQQEDYPVDEGVAHDVLGTYARNAMEEIVRAVGSGDDDRCSANEAGDAMDENNRTLLFVGHAVYLPSVALGVGYAILSTSIESKQEEDEKDLQRKERTLDLILSTNTKEAEGYLLDVGSGEVSLLQRPSEQTE